MNSKSIWPSTLTTSLAQLARRVRGKMETTLPAIDAAFPLSYSELRETFAAIAALGLPFTVLVVRVVNYAELSNAADPSEPLAASIGSQLQRVFGRGSQVGEAGHGVHHGTYTVLLPGMDQLPDLVPRLEHSLSRAEAGDWNGDGHLLNCRIGVARFQLEGSELDQMVSSCSAAAETVVSHCGFAFVGRRHQSSVYGACAA